MFKKIVLFLILTVFTLSVYAANNNNIDSYQSVIKKDKIIVGISYDSKPFGFKDSDGKIKGLEADLAREIAKRLLGNTNKVEFKNTTSQERIPTASSGDVDMVISTMTINSQRKKLVDFSTPYFVAGQVICVKKDSKIDSVYDLINKKIIVIMGTTGEKNIKRFVPTAFIQGYVNNSDAIEAFKNNFGDAITTDDSLLQGLVMDNSNYILLPKKLTKEPYGIAFKKSKQTKTLRNNVNKIIKDMKNDGTLQAIKARWEVNLEG